MKTIAVFALLAVSAYAQTSTTTPEPVAVVKRQVEDPKAEIKPDVEIEILDGPAEETADRQKRQNDGYETPEKPATPNDDVDPYEIKPEETGAQLDDKDQTDNQYDDRKKRQIYSGEPTETENTPVAVPVIESEPEETQGDVEEETNDEYRNKRQPYPEETQTPNYDEPEKEQPEEPTYDNQGYRMKRDVEALPEQAEEDEDDEDGEETTVVPIDDEEETSTPSTADDEAEEQEAIEETVSQIDDEEPTTEEAVPEADEEVPQIEEEEPKNEDAVSDDDEAESQVDEEATTEETVPDVEVEILDGPTEDKEDSVKGDDVPSIDNDEDKAEEDNQKEEADTQIEEQIPEEPAEESDDEEKADTDDEDADPEVENKPEDAEVQQDDQESGVRTKRETPTNTPDDSDDDDDDFEDTTALPESTAFPQEVQSTRRKRDVAAQENATRTRRSYDDDHDYHEEHGYPDCSCKQKYPNLPLYTKLHKHCSYPGKPHPPRPRPPTCHTCGHPHPPHVPCHRPHPPCNTCGHPHPPHMPCHGHGPVHGSIYHHHHVEVVPQPAPCHPAHPIQPVPIHHVRHDVHHHFESRKPHYRKPCDRHRHSHYVNEEYKL